MADALSALPALSGPARSPARSPASPVGAAMRFLLGGLVPGLAWSVVVVAGLGMGIVAFPLGLVAAGGTLMLARLGAQMERERLQALFGERLEPTERPLPARGLVRRMRAAATDPAVWRDVAYFAIAGPLTALSVIVALLWLVVGLVGPTSLLWLPGLDVGLLGIPAGPTTVAVAATLAGIAALAGLRRLPRVVVVPGAWVARSLLGPDVRGLRDRAEDLAIHSELVERVAAQERRRMERDLHDGAQQRMVTAGLALGMLMERLRSEEVSDEIVALAADAHGHVRSSISELRALAQGIHPVALVDGGLGEALEQLAGRSPIPVDLRLDLPPALTDEVARTTYFVAAEALTNAVRHAEPRSILIEAAVHGRVMSLRVVDDGAGGAAPTAGGGLSGLEDRVRSVGGTLRVSSQEGAGTEVDVSIPWRGP